MYLGELVPVQLGRGGKLFGDSTVHFVQNTAGDLDLGCDLSALVALDDPQLEILHEPSM
jgi:hypothetical protein